MVAVRIKSPEQRAEAFMALLRQGTVRSLRGEVYVVREGALAALDKLNVAYQRVALETISDELDALRKTPAVTL
jgi:gamma-glutamylcyclotransferase (GGCT)/AIG2-like uncharacterized protein YtfP